jgi:hypothetical protein
MHKLKGEWFWQVGQVESVWEVLWSARSLPPDAAFEGQDTKYNLILDAGSIWMQILDDTICQYICLQ